MDAALSAKRRDVRIIGMVGVAHLFSHMYQLALPPLFPLIRAELEVSYTSLGLLMGIFYLVSGVMQTPAGFLVDRIGARPVLLGGLGLLAGATALFGFAPSYETMVLLAILGGLGNSVFHPADYAIMSATVSPGRMGRAFSVHTVGGHVGYAMAPVVMVTLGTALGWRGALVAAGIVGIVVVLVLIARMDVGADARAAQQEADGVAMAGVRTFLQPAMLSLFAFFTVLAMGFIGLQSFTATALVTARDFALADGNMVLAGFLIGTPIGVLVGGVIADRTTRHNLVATASLLLCAALIAAAGLTAGGAAVMTGLYFGAGLCFGAALPPRDMVVRAATPQGASGKVFGFVYSGLDTGAAISPVLFGWFVDLGHPMWIFLFAPLFIGAAAVIIVATARLARRRPVAQAAE